MESSSNELILTVSIRQRLEPPDKKLCMLKQSHFALQLFLILIIEARIFFFFRMSLLSFLMKTYNASEERVKFGILKEQPSFS